MRSWARARKRKIRMTASRSSLRAGPVTRSGFSAGAARLGVARHGKAIHRRQGRARQGRAWHGKAIHRRQGVAWRGGAWRGLAIHRRHGMAGHGSAWRFTAGRARRGLARHGEARQFTAGVAWRGSAGRGDSPQATKKNPLLSGFSFLPTRNLSSIPTPHRFPCLQIFQSHA